MNTHTTRGDVSARGFALGYSQIFNTDAGCVMMERNGAWFKVWGRVGDTDFKNLFDTLADARAEFKARKRALTPPNKYLYGYKFYVNYGQGWEYETFEATYRDAKAQRATYAVNCPQYPTKIGSLTREINPAWKGN